MDYRVEMIYTDKRYASVMVEAKTEKEAIEKAKGMKLEDFDERETGTATVWEVKDRRGWYDILMSVFRGRR